MMVQTSLKDFLFSTGFFFRIDVLSSRVYQKFIGNTQCDDVTISYVMMSQLVMW